MDEVKPVLTKSGRICLGVTGAMVALGSFIPLIFVSWALSDRYAELLNIEYGIDPPEELLIYVLFIIPLLVLSAYVGARFAAMFYRLKLRSSILRYAAAFVGTLIGGLLVTFFFSLLVVALAFYT